jgi:hypothetical protein
VEPTVARKDRPFFFSDAAEDVALARELGNAVLQAASIPEVLLGLLVLLGQAALIPELREDDVPRHQRHDHEDDKRAFGNEIALRPKRFQAIGIFYCCGVLGCHGNCVLCKLLQRKVTG